MCDVHIHDIQIQQKRETNEEPFWLYQRKREEPEKNKISNDSQKHVLLSNLTLTL
jgi:hypothetical protein